uniref:Uncharacterized protein n=1 Tax=viral metagenome TaxID=1070528 RepID=A0A6M3IJ41_9ZZZZ
MSDLEHSDREERAAKCNICSRELGVVEILFYGNRCIFCIETGPVMISLISFMVFCYYDYKLYQEIYRLIKVYGHEEGHLLLLGAISELGEIDIAGVKSIKQKKGLLKILRRYKARIDQEEIKR